MSQDEKTWDLIGAIAGVAFAALLFYSIASLNPLREATDQEVQTWWADGGLRRDTIVSMYLMLLAGPCFLVFLSQLRSRLNATNAGSSWNDLVYGAGIIFVSMLGMSGLTRGVVAQAVRFRDEPIPGVDTLRYATQLSQAIYAFVAIPFATIVVAVTSIMIFRTGMMKRWVGWLGLGVTTLSLATIALQMGAFATPLILIWVLGASLQLFRTRGTRTASDLLQLDAVQTQPQGVMP